MKWNFECCASANDCVHDRARRRRKDFRHRRWHQGHNEPVVPCTPCSSCCRGFASRADRTGLPIRFEKLFSSADVSAHGTDARASRMAPKRSSRTSPSRLRSIDDRVLARAAIKTDGHFIDCRKSALSLFDATSSRLASRKKYEH